MARATPGETGVQAAEAGRRRWREAPAGLHRPAPGHPRPPSPRCYSRRAGLLVQRRPLHGHPGDRRSPSTAKPPKTDVSTRSKQPARSASTGKPPWRKRAPSTPRRIASRHFEAQEAAWRHAFRFAEYVSTSTCLRANPFGGRQSHMTTHQKPGRSRAKRASCALSTRRDIAPKACNAHNAHSKNPQVTRPSSAAPGSPRTPRGGSSGTGRTRAACGPGSRPP